MAITTDHSVTVYKTNMVQSNLYPAEEWLNLTDLPVFFKKQLTDSNILKSAISRDKLHRRLQSLISKFLTEVNLELDAEDIADSFDDIPAWTPENVLAKLRSLTEINAKKQIRIFCSDLSEAKRQSTQALLNNAGMYKFRESIEMDLYVGIHTAISANYKMIGIALKQKQKINHKLDLETACEPLFKALKNISALPLGCLMKLDGLFWDSRLYSIPDLIIATYQDNSLQYLINKAELQRRLLDLRINEQRLGCPALKARTATNENSLDLVANLCLKTVLKFSKLTSV